MVYFSAFVSMIDSGDVESEQGTCSAVRVLDDLDVSLDETSKLAKMFVVVGWIALTMHRHTEDFVPSPMKAQLGSL